MKTALVFVAGIAVGIYSVPATLVYVKPVQKALIKSFAKFATEKLSNDAKLRKEAIEHCEKFAELLKEHPEDKV